MTGAGWSGRRVQRLTALVLSTYGDVCHLCARAGATTADHIVPRSHGGTDALDNLRPAHSSCNSARQAMPLAEWFRRHPIEVEPIVEPSRVWLSARSLAELAHFLAVLKPQVA